MTHKEKRTLFTWLEKQGALKKYRVNRFKLTTPDDLPWRAYKFLSIEEAIVDAFNWGQTLEGSGSISNPLGWAFYWRGISEGYDFWNKLDIEWCYYLRSLKHK